MSTITDKFNKAGDDSGNYPVVASVTAARNTGDQVLTVDSLEGWAIDTPVHFSTYRLTADGSVDTSTQTDWKAIVNGNTLTQMMRLAGAADSGNLVGDKVELNPTIGWLSDLVSGLLQSHTQTGALKSAAVASALTPEAVADNLTPEAVAEQFADETSTALNGSILPRHISTALGGYSTTEKDTGMTWIDGRPIYRKTIDFGSLPNNNQKDVLYNIPDLAFVVKLDFIVRRYTPTTSGYEAFNSVAAPASSTAGAAVNVFIRDSAIRCVTNSDRSLYSAYATIFYTKTS